MAIVQSIPLNREIRLRRVNTEDLPQVFQVRVSVQENLLSREQLADMGITENSLKKLMRRDRLVGWCATTGDVIDSVAENDVKSGKQIVGEQIVGFVMIRPQEHDVFALFVAPQWQRRGIGTRLLNQAVTALAALNPAAIQLKTGTNTLAQGFYSRRGWQVSGQVAADQEVVMVFTGDDQASTVAS